MPVDKRVTIQDIAEHANVSKSTVSRVLTGTTPVAEDKKTAVLAAMDKLSYQPNFFARGLASGQSMTIGVLTQNVGSPFYDRIMGGIIAGFQGSGYSPIFADGQWQPAVEQKALQTFLDRHVDGLIVVGGHLDGQQLSEFAEQLPLVIVAREVPELVHRCIFTDNYRSAYEATQFLIDSGHRRIAHIMGMVDQQDAQRRRAGYMQALVDAGIECNDALVVEGNFRRQAGILAVETLLLRGESFTAIFAANDQMAFGARLALFRRGIRVPDDVSLVGFDDEPNSSYMIPPLTTVHQPATEMGETATQAILHLLKDEPFDRPPLTAKLVMRESVARFR